MKELQSQSGKNNNEVINNYQIPNINLMKLLSGGQLQDIAKDYIVDIGKANFAVSNMNLDQVKLNIDKTQIKPIESDSTSAFDFKV